MLQPVDIAESAILFSLKERAILYRLLPKDLAAEVFVELLRFFVLRYGVKLEKGGSVLYIITNVKNVIINEDL